VALPDLIEVRAVLAAVKTALRRLPCKIRARVFASLLLTR